MDEGGVAVQSAFVPRRDPSEVLDPRVEAFHSIADRSVSRLVQSEGTTAFRAFPLPFVHRDVGPDPATTKIGSNLTGIIRRIRV